MRKFEKISFEQFKKDVQDNKKLYNDYLMPKRETEHAAAYDFFSLYDFILKPGEIKKIPTGVKSAMENDDALLMLVRSGSGFNWNVRLCNQVGLIDADYYDNEDNEGHIWIKLQNEGDKDYYVKKGEGFCQGMFIKYLKTDDEENEFIKRKSDY